MSYLHIHADSDEQQEFYKSSEEDALAAFCLLLPGSVLYLTPLLNAKKFRKLNAKKDAVVRVFYQLEEEGLGKTVILGGTKGTTQVCLTVSIGNIQCPMYTLILSLILY